MFHDFETMYSFAAKALVVNCHGPAHPLVPAAFLASTRQKYLVDGSNVLSCSSVSVRVASSRMNELKSESLDTCKWYLSTLSEVNHRKIGLSGWSTERSLGDCNCAIVGAALNKVSLQYLRRVRRASGSFWGMICLGTVAASLAPWHDAQVRISPALNVSQ